jgi:hypothetical protein
MTAAGPPSTIRMMATERRLTPREAIQLPVVLADGTPAQTRDVSRGGLYLIVPAGTQIDDWVRLEFAVPPVGLKFTAAGEVVRIERAMAPATDGVALRLHHSRLSELD